MTLSYSTRYVKHSPLVLTANFSVTFPIFSTSDLRVVVDGAETALFSVNATFLGGRSSDAEIVLPTAVTGVDVEIYGKRLPRRNANYLQSAPDLAGNMQADADILTAVQQEQARDSDLAVKVASGDAPVLSEIVGNAALVFDVTGEKIIAGPDVGDIASAAANAASASAAANAASASAAAALAAENSLLEFKAAWVTATAYAPSDIVASASAGAENGNAYVCMQAHTSGTFATDLAAGKWMLFVAKGASGAGTGDVIGANNGTEFNAGTFRANLALFGALSTAEVGADLLARAAANPRGMAFYCSTGCTNTPPGYGAGDIFISKGLDSNNVTILYVRKDGVLFTNVRSAGTWTGWSDFATAASVAALIAASQQVLHVRDQRVSGTHGGTATAGSYLTRVLNTVLTNTISGASLASNQITLPAGTYEIDASVPGFICGGFKAKLYNVTDGADLIIGNFGSASVPYQTGDFCTVRGRFTLAATKALDLRMRCNVTRATDGLGVALSYGDVEVYADAFIRKIS